MGLYDDIRCEMPLPKIWPTSDFQTKCLGCDLHKYTITADGHLIRKAGGWGGGNVPEMRIPYHGDVEFHDFDRNAGWIGFTARFTEGVCTQIWFREWDPPYGREGVSAPADAAA